MRLITGILAATLLSAAASPGGAIDYKPISAGATHSLALKTDGSVWAWGRNESGQLGNGSFVDSLIPAQVQGLCGMTGVSAGNATSAGIRQANGEVLTWGSQTFGALGNGLTSGSSAAPGTTGITGASSLSQSNFFGLALAGGNVSSWGLNDYGQLGDGTTTNQATPVNIPAPTFVAISGGNSHSIALASDGTVYTWGLNEYGQLGYSTSPSNYSVTPTLVTGPANIIAVAAGGDHCLALGSDGKVLAWGKNDRGQLGRGFEGGSSNVPTEVSGLTNVIAIAAGNAHSLALTADGNVYAWGHTAFGQCGFYDINGPYGLSSPTLVSGVSNVVAIAAGQGHSLALEADGSVWGWGRNDYGQLGRGTVTPLNNLFIGGEPVPAQVQDLTNVGLPTGPIGGAAPTVAITDPQPESVYSVNTPVTFTGTSTGGCQTVVSAVWSFVSPDTSVGANATVDPNTGAISGTHSFTNAGVYDVQLIASDSGNNQIVADTVQTPNGPAHAYVVIYDPAAGYVTGAGWITSPEGAYVASPTLHGPGLFAFVSRYRAGQSDPSGDKTFRYATLGLLFQSTDMEWLVISGGRVQIKGSGKLNGSAGYSYLITGIDGSLAGGKDKLRIKISDGSGNVVYDNQMGQPDSATPDSTTELRLGNVKIHS